VKSADLFFGERFSLTATATRTDGLESIYQYHLGPVIYVDLDQELIPDTFFHQLNWSPNEEQDRASRDITGQRHHGKLCVMLGTVKWRNRLIVRHIRQDMKQKRQILVLTHSVEHSRELYQLYMKKSGNENAGLINGEDVPAEERIPILRESNPVFGTFQLAREALNKQTLDTLFVCTPFGNANDLQQSWGRIQRMKEGKHDPRVRLYEDVQIPTCAKQCRKLRKFLRAMKYPAKILKEALG
jgi:superfamily II DNA or RNA helicase